MTAGRVALAVVLSLVFPGFGPGLAERRARMAAFAVADLVATVGVMFSVWGLAASVVLRLVSAVDAFVCARRFEGSDGSWGLAAIAVLIGAVGVGFANVAVEGFRIPTESMVPTLVVDDQVYVDKLSLGWKQPERGEVLVFVQPCAKKPYVKRVVALAGDTVEVRCGVLYVNGKAASRVSGGADRFRETLDGRTYVVTGGDTHDFPMRDVMIPPSCVHGSFYDKPTSDQAQGKLVETKPRGGAGACDVQAHFVVPAKSLFVMGDNRNNANDSRFWGVVPESALIGRVIGVYAPWSRFGAIR
jgi:signal peptidase I